MPTLSQNPALGTFALTAAALSVLLLVLWALTGVARGKSKLTPNAEDAKGATALKAEDPEGVTRSMRVYMNALANIVPFLITAFAWVMLGADAGTARIIFGVFVGARVLHAFAYSYGKQPWRTIFFVVAQLATLSVIVQAVRAAVAV
jgi:uncharacterized MAPEG superfamily protein